ncbi:MAG: 30S ribosomal protein S6 [Chloroflexota bacterium]|nr:30S ribosomal protein S6 [Chloroflexota bacterium]
MAEQAIGQEAREYELVYIIQPEMDESGILSLNERVAQMIGNHSGEVLTTEMWGRRTLAYPIKRNFEGHYVMQRFTMLPDGTEEIERFLRLNEDVIRYLMFRRSA